MSTRTRFYIGQRVKRREVCPVCHGHGWVDPRPPAAAEAADTIARLTRERDEARAEVDRLREVLAAREQQLRAVCEAWMAVEAERPANNPCPDLALRGLLRERAITLTKDAILSGGQERQTQGQQWQPAETAPKNAEE